MTELKELHERLLLSSSYVGVLVHLMLAWDVADTMNVLYLITVSAYSIRLEVARILTRDVKKIISK